VFDLIGGETQNRSWSVLKPGGVLVSTLGQPREATARHHGARGVGYMAHPAAAQLAECAHLIDAGRVRPVLAATFPLRDVRAAEQRLVTGHVHGKLVIELAA
jgi:NADPH:quinone reductase-like Zn-dependent oxidoreductase